MNQSIHIESSRCIGCGTCMAACMDAHRIEGLQSAPRIRLVKSKDLSSTSTCHHCESPTCAAVCPVDAIEVMDDFILIHEQQCIACGMCSLACPFGAIHPSGTSVAGVAGIKFDTPTFSPNTSRQIAWEIGVKNTAVKCDLCRLTDHGPACVDVCPTNCLMLIDGTSKKSSIDDRRLRAAEAGIDLPESPMKERRG